MSLLGQRLGTRLTRLPVAQTYEACALDISYPNITSTYLCRLGLEAQTGADMTELRPKSADARPRRINRTFPAVKTRAPDLSDDAPRSRDDGAGRSARWRSAFKENVRTAARREQRGPLCKTHVAPGMGSWRCRTEGAAGQLTSRRHLWSLNCGSDGASYGLMRLKLAKAAHELCREYEMFPYHGMACSFSCKSFPRFSITRSALPQFCQAMYRSGS